MKAFLCFALISLASAASVPKVDQSTVNQKFDEFLERYQREAKRNDPQKVNKVMTLTRPQDELIGGEQTVNETQLFGLDQVERVGNVSAVQTGKYSYRVDGQVMLTSGKVSGSIYLYNRTKFINKVSYVGIASTDSVFNFSSTVEYKWNQLVITEFYYNDTAPIYHLAITNCPSYLMVQCVSLTRYLQLPVRTILQEITTLLQSLLAATPLK